MDINPGFPQFSSGGADEDYHTLPQSPKSTVLDESNEKLSFDADVAALDSSNGFECNICLDFARDPVVTLCGHLYCWPCIYKWLHSHSNSQHCPVCKATLSQTTLVPLYGRDQNAPNPKHGGEGAHPNLDIPSRPPSAYSRAHILTTPTTTTLSQLPSPHPHPHPHPHHHSYDNNLSTSPPGSATRVIHPMSGSFRGLAIATLPWLLGNPEVGLYYPGSFYVMGGGSSPVIRHHEQQAKRLLSGVLTFVSCFALLCFLVF